MKRYALQWVILTVIVLWGMVSFLVLAGDEAPANPMSLGQFLMLKAGGLLSFIACVLTGRWLSHKNLLPDVPEE